MKNEPFRYGSVCSGIEAATVAYETACPTWQPAFYSEIDAFPRAVLRHHYPSVPLHGRDKNRLESMEDYAKIAGFQTIGAAEHGSIDLLVGGTPCQSFSIAGNRGGMDDERGNLALEFVRLAERKKATWIKWENVPGVFSSGGGEDFRSILSAFAGWAVPIPDGGWNNSGIITNAPGRWGLAWRVFDAQYSRVAQRRRRVFLIGYLGDWRPAVAVLFERTSMFRDNPPGKGTNPDVAGTLDASLGRSRGAGTPVSALTSCGVGTCGPDDNQAQAGHLLSVPGIYGGIPNKAGIAKSNFLYGGGNYSGELSTAPTLTAHGRRQDFEVEAFVAHIDGGTTARTLTARHDGSPSHDRGPQGKEWLADGSAYTMDTRGVQAVMIGASAAGLKSGGIGYSETTAPSLTSADSGTNSTPAIPTGSRVRRLTPRECERLQGFPDDYTLIDWSKRASVDKIPDDVREYYERSGYAGDRLKAAMLCPDGPRYKALGNSMAVPVMAWLGQRIQMVHELIESSKNG